jgi:hypothetical protein
VEYEQVGMEEALLPPVYLLVYKPGDVLLGYPGFKAIKVPRFERLILAGACLWYLS